MMLACSNRALMISISPLCACHFLQTLGPRHGRKVIKAMDHAGDVRIDRPRGNGVDLFRGCVLDLQYRFDRRISSSRPGA